MGDRGIFLLPITHYLAPVACRRKVDRLTRNEYTCSQVIALNRDHRGPGVAISAALHKRHEFSSFIEEVLIPHPAVQGVVGIGSIATGHARPGSDIDAVLFLDPFDLYVVPRVSFWRRRDGSFHSIFSLTDHSIPRVCFLILSARVEVLRGLFNDLLTQLIGEGVYTEKPISEAFTHIHPGTGQSWDMDEWNIEHHKWK
jgi:hypothetical protein